MQATLTKVQDAQPVGRYNPTAVDSQKAQADFRIICILGKPTIEWRDGKREAVTRRKLASLQAAHSWACDF